VHYTYRSYFDDMLAAGIQIFGFKGGLLHTKSVVVDRHVALFGSFHHDVRSFWLDFEVILGVYNPDFARTAVKLARYVYQRLNIGGSANLATETGQRALFRKPGEACQPAALK
jgi:cardiolipin synthase